MTTVYSVTTEFACHADALALADIIRELGYKSTVSHRTIEADHRTPCRDTRLGKIVLRFMTPKEGAAPRTFRTDDIAVHLEEHDYKGRSASAALSVLCQQGDVKRISDGLFRLAK